MDVYRASFISVKTKRGNPSTSYTVYKQFEELLAFFRGSNVVTREIEEDVAVRPREREYPRVTIPASFFLSSYSPFALFICARGSRHPELSPTFFPLLVRPPHVQAAFVAATAPKEFKVRGEVLSVCIFSPPPLREAKRRPTPARSRANPFPRGRESLLLRLAVP